MTKVVNLRTDPYDVYIGRGSKWGNPFSYKDNTLAIYKVKSRSQSITKYEEYILENTYLLSSLEELKDKTLGCFCKKEGHKVSCHGDILAKLADLYQSDTNHTLSDLVKIYMKLYKTKRVSTDLF